MNESNVKRGEVVCVIDQSGSMATLQDEAISGFNKFLADQKDLGADIRMTTCLFDHEYQLLHDGLDINEVRPLDSQTYVPCGTTALYDAIGRTVDTVRGRIEKSPEGQKPEVVVLMILTDGLENASSDYSQIEIDELLTQVREHDGWEVVYLASNQVAQEVASGIGISGVGASAVNYDSSSRGIGVAYASMSQSVSRAFTGKLDEN